MADRCMPPAGLGSTPVLVDNVVYTQPRIREIVREHRLQALRIRELETRLERADRHLRLRTSALVRLIAKKGPRFDRTITVVDPETWKRLNEEGDRPTPGLRAMVQEATRRRGW